MNNSIETNIDVVRKEADFEVFNEAIFGQRLQQTHITHTDFAFQNLIRHFCVWISVATHDDWCFKTECWWFN